ncbi:MAG: tRNA lysidine(34) synthetase TilS [Acidobacteriia bacterium]|nr:tRNA lysidine(34) synthetase TilS [Terriglobia bacterium]
MVGKVLAYIRERRLIQPGDRIITAVSGGADSVALLRVLIELRPELAIGISVAHFNHKIRGPEAESDEEFVRALTRQLELEFHSGSGDVPAYAREQKMSLEAAARELRQQWFAGLIRQSRGDRIATAHTLDDQAETVLMRVFRGAGSRGLAGIAPWQKEKSLVRPMLCVARSEVEAWLKSLGQPWREDSTNRDLHHTRNRIRHELLPALQRNYNPAIRQTLADLAEIARAEEDYWNTTTADLAARLIRAGKPSRSGRSGATADSVLAVELSALLSLPLALQRRLLRSIAERLGAALEFTHIHELLEFAQQKKPGKTLELPGGLAATRTLRELQISRRPHAPAARDYCYLLSVPGEVSIPELGLGLRAQLVSPADALSRYNSAHYQLLDRASLAPELKVRNWRAGDRYFPAHTRYPKKVKELLQPGRVGHELLPQERACWPVIESAGEIVWMRGFPVPRAFAAKSGEAVLIEELTTNGAGL